MATWPFSFSVVPQLPARIEGLRELSYNLWFSWNDRAIQLLRSLDPDLWEEAGHNPVRMLRQVHQEKLLAAANDEAFCSELDAVVGQLHAYLSKDDRWYKKTYEDNYEKNLVAYFSAEFGLHESLPIYSGGLGILAGDHCKAASDLGVPFVAMGLLYRLGYFRQKINRDGWQETDLVHWNFHELPISEVRDPESNKPFMIAVELPGRMVHAKVWEVKVGLIRLFLLDCDVPENSEEDRKITYQLYGGDHEMRIKQEIVLGIGGACALRGMGLKPAVFHMNEGHAAFLSLERIRHRVQEQGLTFHQAQQYVAASSLFTTHTPVPAGNDAFSPELMARYFSNFAQKCQIDWQNFLKFGRPWESSETDPFSMTILALRMSRQANGVSAIHGRVSREMWQSVWPGVPRPEIPIDHITNGIHTLSWMAPQLRTLFEDKGGVFWEDTLSDPECWKNITKNMSNAEFWEIHKKLKVELIEYARKNLRTQRLRAGYSAPEIRAADFVLDPNTLTIGFARRFATYKRATLLFRDLDRLAAICNHPERPVQFVFAGKAHPADDGGKKLIQLIYRVAQREEFKNKIVFVENYDIEVARYLYHGVDVWMNNPTRPLEASGTSGEKVPPNGGVNFSVRDGWWDEAYDGKNGWAIGEEVTSPDSKIQDEFDSFSIYNLIENQLAPIYYRQDAEGISEDWMRYVRDSLETVPPEYSTFRMVQDYTNKFYRKAADNGHKMEADDYARSRALSEWKQRIRNFWPSVTAKEVEYQHPSGFQITVGDEFQVSAKVHLGEIQPEEVLVEAYIRATSGADVPDTRKLTEAKPIGEGWYEFSGSVQAVDSGSYQFNVRVIPFHPDLVQKHELRLTCWA